MQKYRQMRYPSLARVNVTAGPKRFHAQVKNVSLDGVKLDTKTQPEVGTPIKLDLLYSSATGKIVRKTANDIAIQFQAPLTQQQLRFLRGA